MLRPNRGRLHLFLFNSSLGYCDLCSAKIHVQRVEEEHKSWIQNALQLSTLFRR